MNFIKEIGIDLGTSNTIITGKNKEILLNEPTVAAVDENSGKLVAVGTEAKEMLGRTPTGLIAVCPIREGVIANFNITVAMLKSFIRRATKSPLFKPRAIVCIPSLITEVEKRAVKEATLAAGAKEVFLLESPMAAAIGSGSEVNRPYGSLVVDVGGGITEIAVVSLGGIVQSASLKVAGNVFDENIVAYIKKKSNLNIGEITAEDVKKKIGAVYPLKEELETSVRGRDIVTGLPKDVTITSVEIREALKECLEQILDGVKSVLEKTPPELAADIFDSGIVLSGGGATLMGLGKLIEKITEIPVYIAESPMESVAFGTSKALDEIDTMRALMS